MKFMYCTSDIILTCHTSRKSLKNTVADTIIMKFCCFEVFLASEQIKKAAASLEHAFRKSGEVYLP